MKRSEKLRLSALPPAYRGRRGCDSSSLLFLYYGYRESSGGLQEISLSSKSGDSNSKEIKLLFKWSIFFTVGPSLNSLTVLFRVKRRYCWYFRMPMQIGAIEFSFWGMRLRARFSRKNPASRERNFNRLRNVDFYSSQQTFSSPVRTR